MDSVLTKEIFTADDLAWWGSLSELAVDSGPEPVSPWWSLPLSGLGELVPSVATLSALSAMDRGLVPVEEFDDVLAARVRLINAMHGQLLLDVWAGARVALSPAGTRGAARLRRRRHDYAAVRLAMVLGWEEHQIEHLVLVAEELIEQLPAVLDRLVSGLLDLPRAMAFADILGHLADRDTAREIAAGRLATLAEHPHWPLRALRESLRYHADRAEKDNGRRRHQARVANRGVGVSAKADGCADFVVYNLPLPRAVAMKDRTTRLGRAARAQGDSRSQAQAEADAASDLILGVPFALRPGREASTATADRLYPDPTPPPSPGPDPADRDPAADPDLGSAPDLDPDADTDDLVSAADRRWLFEQDNPTTPTPTPLTGMASAAVGGEVDPAASSGADPVVDHGGRFAALGVLPGDRCVCGGLLPATPSGTMRVTVTLATLAGRSNDPALLGGASITAEQARQAASTGNPIWR